MVKSFVNNTWQSKQSNKNAIHDVIQQVYQIQREDERDFERGNNTRLLFHGTKNSCLMGILSSGMIIKPGNADFTGSMFGDGIYFADSFDKSIQYCTDWTFFGAENH